MARIYVGEYKYVYQPVVGRTWRIGPITNTADDEVQVKGDQKFCIRFRYIDLVSKKMLQ